jgi:hypothetical protein
MALTVAPLGAREDSGTGLEESGLDETGLDETGLDETGRWARRLGTGLVAS